MTNRKAERLRAMRLTVAEVDEILSALNNAKVTSHLDGRQRQHLEDAREQLARARERPVGKDVKIPGVTVVMLMRSIAMTQQWYEAMFAEFDGVEVH